MSESESYSLKETGPVYGEKLEFPDWSGMERSYRKISTERWLAYCKSNLPRIKQHPGYEMRRREQGIPVEFVL